MSTDLRQLSEREREILGLVAAGLSNQQIADDLGVSVNTVKVHLRNVFGKIGATSRTEATMYAVRAGLVTVGTTAPPSLANPVQDTLSPSRADEAAPAAPIDLEPPAEPEVAPAEVRASEPMTTLVAVHALEPAAVPAEASVSRPTAKPAPQEIDPASGEPPIPAGADRSVIPRRRGRMLALLTVIMAAGLLSGGAWAFGWLGKRGTAAPAAENVRDDPARWRTFPHIPTPRAAFAIANVDGLVYVIGGEGEQGILDGVERFDARSETWTSLSRKPTPVTDIHAVVIGGKIYVPGGRRSADPKDITAVLERYDPRNETWEQLPPLPEPRSAYALASVEGKLYLFGGWDGATFRADVFEYDPAREAWAEGTPMPTARGYMDAAVVEGSVYVPGGENADGQLSINEVYIPAREGSQPWQRKAPMPEPHSRFNAVAALSLIYVLGGTAPSAGPPRYNTRTDSWQRFAAPPQAMGSQSGAVLLDELIVSLGGRLDGKSYMANMQAYQAVYTLFVPGTQQ